MTFAAGLAAVLLMGTLYPPTKQEASPGHSAQNQRYPTSEEGKPEVLFKGFVEEGQGLVAEFEIINFSTTTVLYTSQSENYPFHFVRFNGKEDFTWYCGTGAREWAIAPGSSITVKLSALIFKEHLKKSGKLKVGFAVGEGKIWSTEFTIPDYRRVLIEDEWERASRR